MSPRTFGVPEPALWPLAGNLADAASVQSVVRGVEVEWGRLNVLVNNAGVGTIFPFLDTDPGEWDPILDINLRGLLLHCYHGGRPHASEWWGLDRQYLFPACRDWLAQEVRLLRVEGRGEDVHQVPSLVLDVAKVGIRVNAIDPGVIRPAMSEARLKIPERLAWYENRVPLGRVGEPEDLVGAAVFLASDESAYVTGTSVYVDGDYLDSDAW